MRRLVGKRWIGVGLFALIWLGVLSVPALRLTLRLQTVGSTMLWQEAPWTPWLRRLMDVREGFSAARLKYPNDAAVQAKAAEEGVAGNGSMKPAKITTQAYDRLIERFPNETWLLANRLRHTMRWFRDDRLGGDFENPIPPPHKTPSPEKTGSPPSFSPAELEQCIAVAQRGRRLEPDNNFWDWMLAIFLLADYRDEEAFKVIAEGSRKPRFDDHAYDDIGAAIAAREKVRPLIVEEKIAVSAAQLIPHLAKFRETARLVSWQAWKAERAGDHKRALQMRGDFARMCAPMMRGRNTIISGLVGRACQAIMRAGSPARRGRGGGTRRQRVQAQAFANYATKHSRPDLAAETLRLSNEGIAFQAATRAAFNRTSGGQNFFGVPTSVISAMASWWLLGLASLGQIVFLMVWCAGLSLFLIRSRPAPAQPHARDLALSLLVCTLAAAGFAWLAFGAQAGVTVSLLRPAFGGRGSLPQAIVGLLGFVLAPLFFSALLAWGVTLWRMWRNRNELFPKAEPRYEGASAEAMPRDLFPLAVAFCVWSAVATTFLCWAAALAALLSGASNLRVEMPGVVSIDIADPATFANIALVLSALCYLGWLVKWRWFAPPLVRPLTHYALRWHRQTMSLFVLVSSVAWIVFAVGAQPARRQADAHFAAYLQRGEIASLLAKPAK